jgi:amino acid adenylation domain-containing protein
MTVLPRWRDDQATGVGFAECRVPLSRSLSDGVSRLAGQLGVADSDILFAAHLAVIGTVAGEAEPTTGVSAGIVRATLVDGAWHDVVRAAHTALRHGESGVADTGFSADGEEVPADGLSVVFDGAGGAGTIRLRYRTDAFTAEHAGRIAGYLVRALESMVADPASPWQSADLLSASEREQLLHGRAGAARPLPDRSFAELFAEQARRTPEAEALLHPAEVWTYRRLDEEADRIAHRLLRHGVRTEEVVGLAAHRDASWAAALIGILRAGAAYLPIEPSLPAARVAEMVASSGCRTVLTGADRAGAPLLTRAGGAATLAVDELLHDGGADGACRVPVGPHSLAYVYFTSGSTGPPKGAMCEHLGMVNHLYAKIDDLSLCPDDLVVHNAQPSFDISLWQLAAPLLVGARVLIVPRETALDVNCFLDHIVAAGASVLQVVPAYLELLLRCVESRPRDLRRLRLVSVTGEAIAADLVRRWFAEFPDIPLVNAYGATEASDDTTHAMLTEPPVGDLVPVGQPVGNVTIYVLGDRGELVPTGSIGEIAFSGISVGRGYINDPARTAEVFGADPFRPGTRMYRTGDFGRWLPSGQLEFHGRRDEQVKIRGIRIEVGEVESRMRAHPLVREASVVVLPDNGSGKRLIGFYTGDTPLAPAELQPFLAAALPEAGLPSRLHLVDALPLNQNGKVDKRALLRQAQAAQPATAVHAPATAAEQRIAQAWATALNRPVDTIGRDSHFFDLGGTSLSALRAVVALGGLVTIDDLVRAPVLSALAALTDGTGSPAGHLLRLLSGPAANPGRALLCMPYAAGSAVNFQALATALARRAPLLAVHAAQPPGHDLGSRDSAEPVLELNDVAERVTDEVLTQISAPIALWGHCTGAALALEVGRRLEDAGRPVAHLLLAGCTLPTDPELVREVAVVTATPDERLGAGLAAQGGLDALPATQLAFAGRVYRHDVRTANQYLLDAARLWGPRRLSCPVTVVVSTTDPLIRDFRARFGDWSRFAAEVHLAEVDGGGHYFPRTRPDETAEIVLRAWPR